MKGATADYVQVKIIPPEPTPGKPAWCTALQIICDDLFFRLPG